MKFIIFLIVIFCSSLNLDAQSISTKVNEYLEQEQKKIEIPNLEVLIINKDSVLYSNSLDISMPNTIYYIGSVSKSLTAFGIMRLIQKRKLYLTDKVVDIIPNLEFQNGQNEITVWNLLTHTSGIKKVSGFNDLPSLKEISKNSYRVNNKLFSPIRHEYSNLNYSLLGLIIEAKSNLGYKDFMTREVFTPLEMNNSIIGNRDEISSQLIEHYQYFGLFPVESKQLNYSSSSIPAGFICSSISDLGNYLKCNINRGDFNGFEVLDSMHMEIMHTVWDRKDYGYALGWKKGKYNDMEFYQHLGSTANSYSGIFFIPETEIGFILLSNSNTLSFSENLAEGILNILTNGKSKQTSNNEFYIRLGIMFGYFFVFCNFVSKIIQLIRNKSTWSNRKTTTNLMFYFLLLISLLLVFQFVAEIPFTVFLKIQPDLGILLLLSIVFPLTLEIAKVVKTKQMPIS